MHLLVLLDRADKEVLALYRVHVLCDENYKPVNIGLNPLCESGEDGKNHADFPAYKHFIFIVGCNNQNQLLRVRFQIYFSQIWLHFKMKYPPNYSSMNFIISKLSDCN